MEILHKSVTDKILRAFYNVYSELGYGFAEKCYENAMIHELNLMGVTCEKQLPIKVLYKGKIVGEYFADIVVNEVVIIELKAATSLISEHEVQLLNYLKATNIEIGLLLNFGDRPCFKRLIFTNDKKAISASNVA